MNAKEKLEVVKNKYANAWFDGLIKSWKTDSNKKSLLHSYKVIGELAVKAFKEENSIE